MKVSVMKHHPREKNTQGIIKLMSKLSYGRVFVSMPSTPLTPRAFIENPRVTDYKIQDGVMRKHGILPLNECTLSPFDHGNLYGDGIFEGILIRHGQVYKFKEHLKRLQSSAKKLGIKLPYSLEELAKFTLETARTAKIKKSDTGYVRLVVTRGIGNLGIDPRKCVGATVYIIVAQVTLYPKEKYKTGIHMGIAKTMRRPGKNVLDPTVKSLNYLNNIQALREGVIASNDKTIMEALELTHRGYVAEATADNLFIVDNSAKKPILYTAVDDYALKGITRSSIIDFAKNLKIKTVKSATLLPEDLLGRDKEVFLTGTAAGVMPVVKFHNKKIGNGRPGRVTLNLMKAHQQDQKNPRSGLSLKATKAQIKKYVK